MNSRTLQKCLDKINKNLVIKGTLILTLTGFATRIIGFYNRIFLADLIGAKALGVYQLIFPIYMVAFSFTTMGNELALTKLVSEYKSRCDYYSAKVFFRVCFFINLVLGIGVCLVMRHKALWICTHLLNAPQSADCIKIISLGIPFMSMKGAIHGYFLGLEKSEVHGISDFLEQCAKVGGLYVISTFIFIRTTYSADFAVWGIVIGEIVAFSYSLHALIRHNTKTKNDSLPPYCSPENTTRRMGRGIHYDKAVRLFVKDSLPITANRLSLTLLQSMEAILIPNLLLSFYNDSALSLATYGIFSGMAFPFIMFPSTITNSLSTMLLPAVSSANSRLDRSYLKSLCRKSLQFCLIIGALSTAVFFLFGGLIGTFFFHNKEAGQFLYQLSFLCPFIYLATNLASILNGLGHATHNLFLTVISTGIRIGFILFTVPRLGMTGYIIGLFVSYIFLTLACIFKLKKLFL